MTTAITRHLYRVRYRRADNPSRVYRATVIARDADEAREFVRLRDEAFHSTVASPKRGREVVPEQADGLTAAKGQEWVAHLDGGRFGDIEVEVVD